MQISALTEFWRALTNIPGRLFEEGSKQYDIATFYIDGVTDVKVLVERTGASRNTVYNVKGQVNNVVTEILKKKGLYKVDTREISGNDVHNTSIHNGEYNTSTSTKKSTDSTESTESTETSTESTET